MSSETPTQAPTEPSSSDAPAPTEAPVETPEVIEELGGPKGPEPTRFGDWERGGRCSDF